MRTYFVAHCSADKDRLPRETLLKQGVTPRFCSDPGQVDAWAGSDAIIFLISETSMLSSQFQDLTLRLMSVVPDEVPCWLLYLDEAPLPLGFKHLTGLPEINL